MATAPVKHEPVKHTQPPPVHHDPVKNPAKVVGQEGALVLPPADPAIGDKPLVGATGVKGEHIEDGERDPDTIAEEQRRRSEDYENAIGGDPVRRSPNDRTNEEQDALQHARQPQPKK